MEDNKVLEAITKSYAVNGKINFLEGEITDLGSVIDSDSKEIARMKKVEERIKDNQSKLQGLKDDLKIRMAELGELTVLLEENGVRLPFSVKATKSTKL